VRELEEDLRYEKLESERFSLLIALMCLPLPAQRALVTRGKEAVSAPMRSLCEKIVLSDGDIMKIEDAEQLLIKSNTPYYTRVYCDLFGEPKTKFRSSQ
jgi:hypothetical protein